MMETEAPATAREVIYHEATPEDVAWMLRYLDANRGELGRYEYYLGGVLKIPRT
jgi:hypothetical protein